MRKGKGEVKVPLAASCFMKGVCWISVAIAVWYVVVEVWLRGSRNLQRNLFSEIRAQGCTALHPTPTLSKISGGMFSLHLNIENNISVYNVRHHDNGPKYYVYSWL